MGQGTTSFWKVFLGVTAAILFVGALGVGGCLLLVGYTVTKGSEAAKQAEKARESYRGMMVVNLDKLYQRGNYAYIEGSVKNAGQKNVSYWKLTAKILDKAGNVVDTDFTNSAETLYAGETKRFQMMQQWDRRFATATVEVDEVRID